jgi:hypothetical protein
MLAQVSTQLPTRDQLTAKGADGNDFGLTTPPVNFVVPRFNIVCQHRPRGQGWSAHVQILQRAHEGHNEAYHLGPGIHSTDRMLAGTSLTNYVPGPGNRRVYVEVSPQAANYSRDAEQEHCADTRHAFNITLGAVQAALDAARDNGPYAGYAKHEGAVRAARMAIRNGLHPRLQTIVDAAIGAWNVNMISFAHDLGKLYLAMSDQSQDRDNRMWHQLEPDRTGESWSLRSWAEYGSAQVLPSFLHTAIAGEVKDIRKLVRGPQFQVNVTPSHAVVFL